MPGVKSKLSAPSPMTVQLTHVPMLWHNGEDVQRPHYQRRVSGKDKVTQSSPVSILLGSPVPSGTNPQVQGI